VASRSRSPPARSSREAVDRNTDRLVNEIGDALEQAAHRAGWK
jgi:hypothetical protein